MREPLERLTLVAVPFASRAAGSLVLQPEQPVSRPQPSRPAAEAAVAMGLPAAPGSATAERDRMSPEPATSQARHHDAATKATRSDKSISRSMP